ncbi:MAG TPA: HAD family hydrolase [Chthoniobacteraceae bacterium]|jgi:hydroxymethylpyrimidine pyrophosphatase-like HAD family hydrolase|nr:HAD family hydrolase [Chthoniobacteraceae bacterium]
MTQAAAPTFQALATDYDGTIATHGIVDPPTMEALERLRAAGRRVILVTGREIDDLRTIFPELTRFDLIVGENGALLYWPATGREELLAKPPPPEFSQALRDAQCERLSIGRVIVATFEPYDRVVFETIKAQHLELQVIFNKGAVMVLPTGVNKASGLRAAVKALGITTEEVVGVGDAENDHAFLEICGFSVAVSNALDVLKRKVRMVTRGDHGRGVTEMINQWLSEGLHAEVSRYQQKSNQ